MLGQKFPAQLVMAPHKVHIQWIPFDKAPDDLKKCVTDDQLFLDDPRFVAGYLVMPASSQPRWLARGISLTPADFQSLAMTLVEQPRSSTGLADGKKTFAVAVKFAPSPETRSRQLLVDRVDFLPNGKSQSATEHVFLLAPYDPAKLPARYVPRKFTFGIYTVTASYADWEPGRVGFWLSVDRKDGAKPWVEVETSEHLGGGTLLPGPFLIEGHVAESGEASCAGTIRTGDGRSPYRDAAKFSLTISPGPERLP
jgi:hypothetical protein